VLSAELYSHLLSDIASLSLVDMSQGDGRAAVLEMLHLANQLLTSAADPGSASGVDPEVEVDGEASSMAERLKDLAGEELFFQNGSKK
jgi:hypothetical protein